MTEAAVGTNGTSAESKGSLVLKSHALRELH